MYNEAEEAFQEFVRSRWSALVRTAYLLTGDRHLAEDVVQSTLAKAYRSWPRVCRSDNPDAYVRRMLVTCHRDRFRKRRVAEHLTDIPPEEATAQDDMARADEREVLARALAGLPKRQRAVVVLRYWEDLSEPEVARALGCSVGTVKSQAAKALAKLRVLLGSSRLALTG
ncbi:SigE family RNA polymerase sigma factor [Streptomyces hoynatensis]|uniref:SigE family RNA polymerase sigma factor n=1 Tax=Streptomyces hoynatensis TaxID=1141874 RepID=A0A3A9ZEZ1_9ACTN|nr:SigE family RNA polymerase sigma factor [Streptomyces hoynatensis]RKN46910.1 SigE family RNA polymerase sigma factor [Streptomyces hoynatensis]